MKGIKLQILYGLLAIALVVVVNVLFLTFLEYEKLVTSLKWVSHTHEVIRKIYELQASLATGEADTWSSFAAPGNQTSELEKNEISTQQVLSELKMLTSDNAVQQRSVEKLKGLADAEYQQWKVIVSSSKPPIDDGDRLLNNTIQSDNRVAAVMVQMRSLELSLLAQRESRGTEDVKSNFIFLCVAALSTIALAIFVIYLLNDSVHVTRALYKKIDEKNAELNRSNRELEQFAYIASHDLHEPLRKIRAFSERLKSKETNNLSEDGIRILDKITGFAAKMQRLIDDLLDYSRITNSQLEPAETDLNRSIEEAIASLSEKIQTSGAHITFKNLPVIKGYPTQITRLFQNLISNSLKYAHPGTVPQIFVSAGKVKGSDIPLPSGENTHSDFWKISFRDSGIGFEQQYAEKIFVIFQRLHGKSEYEGSGIGLAVVKAVMDNHSGYVKALGKEGEGAEFLLYFPA